MKLGRIIGFLLMTVASISFVSAQMSFKEHTELGTVNWHRNFEEAKTKSAEQNKPILILFQEVPGCAACQNYGQDALSHPLLVEAMESLFIPTTIFNNKKGRDETLLRMFKEPSWNNPVVRIVDAELNELAPRLGSNYSKIGLLNTMFRSLINSNLPIPEYLYTLEEEFKAEQSRTAKRTYSMYCFWSGEKA
ncbi:MAG: thioredoxin family protein, partial [Bacteroidota bacterium]